MMDASAVTNVSAIPATIKDAVQILAWVSAVGVGFFGVLKGLNELRRSREERKNQRLEMERELRWNRARLSRDVLAELFNNPKVRRALEILDISGSEYDLPTGEKMCVSHEDLPKYLRTKDLELNERDLFVRGCFDELFSGLETIEHYLYTDLLVFEDVQFPLAYHLNRMREHNKALEPYIKQFHFTLISRFMARFDSELSADVKC